MVANASSVRTQVLIGDDLQDWSSTLETIDLGWSKRDRSGIFFIDGTIVLDATLYPPESLDARKNPERWKRGQKVIVNVDLGSGWVRHPLGNLYIIKEPLPPHPGNPKITIKVGDILRLRDYKQPDDDKSNITPGEATNRGTIIQNILSGANIPFSESLNDWPLDAPIPKQDGGSFVSQSGEVAYAALQALYQNNNGLIKLKSLKATAENPIITISIGGFFKGNYEELGSEPTEDTTYEPLEGSETPADKVKAVGNKKSNTSGLGTNIVEIWEYAPAQIIDSTLEGIIVSKHTVITESTFLRQRIVQERVEMPLGLINSTAWPKDPTLSLASESVETYTYEGSQSAKLINIIKDTKKPFVSAMSEYWNALNTANKNATRNLIIYGEKSITEWQYGSDEVPIKQIVTTYETIGSIVPDEGTLTNADQLAISQIQTTQWINQGAENIYRKIESTDTAIGKGFSDIEIAGGTATERANLKLAVINTNYIVSISNSGQNNPPAAERAPAAQNEKEEPIEGTAEFETAGTQEQPRERVIQVKYAVDKDQLSQIAQVEGTLLIGKRLGQRIQVPFVSAFVNHPEPCPQIISIEPDGTTYLFIADGIEYSHTTTKSVVGFDGIWVATLPALNGSPLNYSPGVLIAPYKTLISDSETLAVLPPSQELGLNLYGGFVLGGTVTVLPYDTVIPNDIDVIGGFVLGGNITNAVATNLYGGFVLGGSITVNSAVFISVSGGFVLGGSIVIPVIDTQVIGGFVVGGSVAVTADLSITGGFVLGGSIEITTATSISVVGGIVLGGNVDLATVDTTVTGGFVLGGSVDASPSYEAEFTALLARFTGSYSTPEQVAKNTLIAALKSASLWSTIDTLKIAAGSKNSADALLNWKGTSNNSSVTGSLTYYTEHGFVGFTTSNYLTDGFIPSSAGGNYAQNSATVAIYSLGDGQSSNVAIGGNSASSTTHSQIVLRDSSNRLAITNNAGSSQTVSSTNTVYSAVGLTTNTRTASNAIAAYKGSTSIVTGTTNSTGNLSVAHNTGNQNNNGTPATADANLCWVVELKASGWNSTQVGNFYSALNTYLQTCKKSSHTFTYSSDGDTNGLFYWIGTNANQQAWANPAYTASNPGSESSYNNNAHILLSASGYGSGTIGSITDRTTGTFQSNNVNGCWVKSDTGRFRSLSCNKYSLRHINSTGSYLRNWKLQGSNDDSSWTDLDIRTSDTTINSSSGWGTFTPNQGVSTSFRWFRILVTDFNSSGTTYEIRLGEWELYGTLTISTPTTFTYSGLPGDQSGIIYYLACNVSDLNWANGWVNPHASGAITISASTVGSGNVSLLCDRNTGLFQSTNAANSFVQIDFGASRTTRVDSYLIRNANVSSNLLRNWSLQGSTDGSAWTDLDIRTSDTTITTTNQFYHLTCNQGNTSYWRYIRLLQTGVNSNSTNSLTVGDIELYGAIA